MLESIRSWIVSWLLFKDRTRLANAQGRYEMLLQELEAARADFGAYRASLTITDLIREQLKGINPKLFENDNDILVEMAGEDSINTFLSGVHDLNKSNALSRILDVLIRDQVLHSAKEAIGLDEINFGRATVNGLSLLREEVGRLDTVYLERHAKEPEFDEHSVV